MIKDQIFSVLHQIPTADLSLESLSALIAIMLAQAQEAFCLKAIQGMIYSACCISLSDYLCFYHALAIFSICSS